MQHLLIVSHDVVGQVMAGPGIRYYQLARVMGQHLPTTLALPAHSDRSIQCADVAVVYYSPQDWQSLAPYVEQATVCLLPGDLAGQFPQLAAAQACLVIDGYNPLLAEWLALNHYQGINQSAQQLEQAWQQRMINLAPQCLLGDFYLCASERQRDWWLGLLEAFGRITPAAFQRDPTLRSLVNIAPYGVDESSPVHNEQVLKGVWPGIGPDDKVLLWGGGLWPWLDALTAIRAVAKLSVQRPTLRLVFPGARHPNPAVAQMPTQLPAAQALAAELGLLDRVVFFGDWVPYQQWQNYLLESDLTLSLHFNSLETRLAFRSRLFECLRADLPIIATQGDATSDLIAHYGLGTLVACEDVEGVATAIEALLQQPASQRKANFAAARRDYSWEKAALPLLEFCKNPQRAADRNTKGYAPGHPHLQQSLRQAQEKLVQERDHWQQLANGYANGRVMKLLLRLSRWWRRGGVFFFYFAGASYLTNRATATPDRAQTTPPASDHATPTGSEYSKHDSSPYPR